MRQSNQARYDTLQELIKWCEEEMNKCENQTDRYIITGVSRNKYPGNPHWFHINDQVQKIGANQELYVCRSGETEWCVHPDDLKQCTYLNTDRYNAFKEMKEKLEKL